MPKAPLTRCTGPIPKPVRSPLPEVADKAWARNAVDRFILARLEREGLKPSVEAERHLLIRRVSLDLTGLPPTPQEVEGFLRTQALKLTKKPSTGC